MRCKPSENSKGKQKKGLWSPDEDERLKSYILKNGHGSWSSLPIKAGLERNGKSCRLRWINYLRPGLKRGTFTIQEEETVLTLHGMIGNKWSQIAQHLPGRTDNEIKNYWHSYLKKKLIKTENSEEDASLNTKNIGSSSSCSSLSSFEQTEGSPTPAYQLLNPNTSLPKVLFADWLSLDQFQSQEYNNLSPLSVAKEDCMSNSNYQDVFGLNELLSERVYGSSTNVSVNNVIFRPEVKYEDQNMGRGFVDLITEDNINMCSDFDMNDVLYI